MAKKALLIGINYVKQDYALFGCINNAKNIYFSLRNKFAFSQNCIAGLLEVDATRKNILSGMKWLVKDAKPGDILLMSFSGHGSKEFNNECIIPYDWTMNGEISDHEIHDIFATLPSGVKVVTIFDSSHSKSIMNLKFSVKDVYHNPSQSSYSLAERFERLSHDYIDASIICFSGSMDTDTSDDVFEDVSRGVVTLAFQKTLDNHPDPKTMKISELFYGMQSFMKKHGYQQTVLLSSSYAIKDDELLVL